jgi:hypothetical protein
VIAISDSDCFVKLRTFKQQQQQQQKQQQQQQNSVICVSGSA